MAIFFGTPGNDWRFGTSGDDRFFWSGGDDWLYGGSGDDMINYYGGTSSAVVDLEARSGRTGGSTQYLHAFEDVVGTNFNDRISGNGAANELSGGSGNDTIYGRGGDDRIFGSSGKDWLYGGDHDDYVSGGADDDVLVGDDGDDFLTGEGGDDVLVGGRGVDTLKGGSGDDEIDGGLYADDLYGGSGADTFRFLNAMETTNDDIIDFERGIDKIDVRLFKTSFAQLDSNRDGVLNDADSTARQLSNGELRISVQDNQNDLNGVLDVAGHSELNAADFIF